MSASTITPAAFHFLPVVLGLFMMAAASSATGNTPAPSVQGWEVVAQPPNTLRSPQIAGVPFEASLHLDLASQGRMFINLVAPTAEAGSPPLLNVVILRSADAVQLIAKYDDQPMESVTTTSRTWSIADKATGAIRYAHRFPTIKNLWDDRDRAEIGSSYVELTPLDKKIVVLRFVVTETSRQVWLDDRLVGEGRVATAGPVHITAQTVMGDPSLVHADILTPEAIAAQPPFKHNFQPLTLNHYRSSGLPVPHGVLHTANDVPYRIPGSPDVGFDLGKTIWRYRLTVGSGPDAPYVNGLRAWPDAFTVDPVLPAFRVPYRTYKNIHLLAWMDDEPNSTPRGTVRFFRENTARIASMDFEITEAAIARGDVTRLPQRSANDQQLFLIKVPVDSAAFYDFVDMHDQYLNLQVTKPVSLVRSYPDPIYYGEHPAGLPSSIHVVGITLEASDFSYVVTPAQVGHVFQTPQEAVDYTVTLTNHTAAPLPAQVTLTATAYESSAKTSTNGKITIPPNATVDLPMTLTAFERFGYHDLHVKVAVGDEVRENKLSLVRLAPNTRTYGTAANETRFGAWNLLGHHVSFQPRQFDTNAKYLGMLRKLGIRRNFAREDFVRIEDVKANDLLADGAHTIVSYYHRLNIDDPEQVQKWLADETALTKIHREHFPNSTYYYGGEWNYDHVYSYAALPRFVTGEPYKFSEAALKNLRRQAFMFNKVGRMLRELDPTMKLILQWGAPMNTVGFLEEGFPQDLIDGYGMDMPMFELTPEVTAATGAINTLWQLRQEFDRLGRPQLPLHWCEGPFLPTNPGALTEAEQAQNQVRYWLMGMAYDVQNFEAGVVPHDAGNYYGAEHYGAGVFRARPLDSPKPAVAALATATEMVCGADVTGPIDTGSLTTYALALHNKHRNTHIHALWRAIGDVTATIHFDTDPGTVTLTDSQSNTTPLTIRDGKTTVVITPTPGWLTAGAKISRIELSEPTYTTNPEWKDEVTHALPAFGTGPWTYDGSAVPSYADNHIGVARITDPQLTVDFSAGESGRPDALSVILPEQPAGDRSLAARYGVVRPPTPVQLPGKPAALGVWVKGNSSWGRIAYEVTDANGERWTSIGTANDWNCDDPHTWSFIKHDGWRYIRFPLPGNREWDAARELETTWWKHEGGDGIVDLPLSLTAIYVEARNETLVLGEMKLVKERAYKLAGLEARYTSDTDMTEQVIAFNQLRMPAASWPGPQGNLIASMRGEERDAGPEAIRFEEPLHFNDGRRMVIRVVDAKSTGIDQTYQLYLSRYEDGRGAEKFGPPVKNDQEVRGFRPGVTVFIFATRVTGRTESTPTAGVELTTQDKFREK